MNSTAQAAEYYRFNYEVSEGDTFSSILKKFVTSDAFITGKTPLVIKTMKENPKVRDWTQLAPGTALRIYISPDVFDLAKYRKFESANVAELKQEIKIIQEEKSKVSGWKSSAFYMLSSGVLSQTAKDGTTLTSSRNSPFTAGLNLNYLPNDTNYSASTSAYVCMLTSSKASTDNSTVANPTEFGSTLYGEYRFVNKNFNVYSGLDFETLSGYNFQTTASGQKLYVENSKIFFLTAGVSNFFTLFNLPLFTKASISKSVMSSYDDGAGSASTLKYSGVKALLYINYKFTDKFFFHSMIKYHSLSGPSQLNVLRIGVGAGYILF